MKTPLGMRTALEKMVTRVECECFDLDKLDGKCSGKCTPARARCEFASLQAFRQTIIGIAVGHRVEWIRHLAATLKVAEIEGFPESMRDPQKSEPVPAGPCETCADAGAGDAYIRCVSEDEDCPGWRPDGSP